jgi:Holliday junction DNA helicase RuvA
MIARAPGVGPKMAARICAELKDKAPALSGIDSGVARLQAELGDRIAPRPASEAVSALVNLGYAQAQASAAVAAAMREAGEGAETTRLIRLGLKELAR